MRKSATLPWQDSAMYCPWRIADNDRAPRAAVPSPVIDDDNPMDASRGIMLGMALGLGSWILIGFSACSLLT
jgi:hypothetical protein